VITMNGDQLSKMQAMLNQTLPPRVNVAFQFAMMMRHTACAHVDHEKEFPGMTTVIKSTAERDTYAAAMGVLRTFFNGESEFSPIEFGYDDDDPAPPAGPTTTPATAPAPPSPDFDPDRGHSFHVQARFVYLEAE
jgi:hypothetical protein